MGENGPETGLEVGVRRCAQTDFAASLKSSLHLSSGAKALRMAWQSHGSNSKFERSLAKLTRHILHGGATRLRKTRSLAQGTS